jgi:integrase
MAYFKKLASGKWRAQVERNGVRVSAVRDTKAEAANWAATEEAALIAAKRGQFPRKTLADALDRYAEEVSSRKRGARSEALRLEAFKRDFADIASKVIWEVQTPDMARWRDARLKVVSAGSVQRDINLLSNVFTVARDEWKWCGQSPFVGMRRPGDNPARTRRVKPAEVKAICRWLGYRTGDVKTKQQEVALAFLVALRTGMRAGEVLSLSDKTVDIERRTATVNHKTQHITGKPRTVPLSRPAIRLLRPMLARGGNVFTVSGTSLDALFRKARDSLQLNDIHFHDSRAEALTRFSKKVDVMTLARISGHKDLRVLLDSYYRESAADIAARLD